MPKTILVPTDFRIESLNTLKLALSNNNSNSVEVILMYSEQLSNSISEMLFYSPDKVIDSAVKPEFQDALAILKNRFEKKISSLRIELFHGYNLSAFKNFLEANQVDEIFIPKTYTLKPPKNGFNPISLIKKSNVIIHEMEWMAKSNTVEEDQLDALFNNLNVYRKA